ncbi:MAG: gliding motility-associated C-terminal domain-containing protein, partial [Minisyncoccia bacterium]
MKKILKYFLCLTSLPFGEGWGGAYAQNLVSNPSFENFTSCPTGGGQINKAFPWFNPTFNTPNYYNSCSINASISVPANQIGYQNPRTGNAYGELDVFYGTPNGRTYIETPLSDTLIKGKKYCVEFYVSLAEVSKYASSSIQVYFSKDSIYDYSTLYNLPYIAQFENISGNVISDTVNWILVSGTYIAGGGEKYMTIGNFKDDANTDTVSVGLISMYCLYYIDDISIVQFPEINAGADESICEGETKQLNASCIGCWAGLKYRWQPASGLSDTSILNPIASPTQTTTYYLSIIDTTDTITCIMDVKDTITIIVCDHELEIPNIFTPNNDGINDVFKITTKNITTLNCKIYNRWGILVGELTKINEGWDGRSTSGLQCTTGVYYYV